MIIPLKTNIGTVIVFEDNLIKPLMKNVSFIEAFLFLNLRGKAVGFDIDIENAIDIFVNCNWVVTRWQ